MAEENSFEIVGCVEIAQDIENKVKTTGVRGLDIAKAKELGVFQRISNLLCVTHASIMAAYRVYYDVYFLIGQLNANKNEIVREMNLFEKAFKRFCNFWTGYYAKGKSGDEVNYESERLYHKIMEWMQMPETWQLGEKQRTELYNNTSIHVKLNDGRFFTFSKAKLNKEIIDEPKESWGVFCYNHIDNKQTSVHTNMDKASALMVAKRLSKENPDNIYCASIMRDFAEKKTEIIPFKVFRNNETVGKLTE